MEAGRHGGEAGGGELEDAPGSRGEGRAEQVVEQVGREEWSSPGIGERLRVAFTY